MREAKLPLSLQTCPVLLILLTNMPRGKFKRPEDTLLALVANQIMIVFGVAAVFYTGPAKAILYLIGCLSGAVVFKTAVFTFLRASESFPVQARGPLWFAAGCFFVGWLMFPILWLLGPEGYGNMEFGISQVCHALADLVSKNSFGFISWYIRFKIIKPWEIEQQRLKREAAEKEAEFDADPAFQRAYDGGYGPPAIMDGYGPITIRRTPATIGACNSLLDAARRFVDDRKVNVLLIEEEGLSQKSMLDAFEGIEECRVEADVLFSLEDVPRLYERGVPKYAAVFINVELLKHLVGLPESTVKEMELDVYTDDDFREEHREMRKVRRKNIRRVEKALGGEDDFRRRDEEEEEEEDFFLYDSEEDARAAFDDEAGLHVTQRLFGARAIIAYRLGRGSKKASKEDRSKLGYNVFLKHPTDASVLSRVFYRLAPRMGVETFDSAHERLLEQVMGTVEATVMSSQHEGYGYGYGDDGYGDDGHSVPAGAVGGRNQRSTEPRGIPRQSSSLMMMGQALHPDAYEMPPPVQSRQHRSRGQEPRRSTASRQVDEERFASAAPPVRQSPRHESSRPLREGTQTPVGYEPAGYESSPVGHRRPSYTSVPASNDRRHSFRGDRGPMVSDTSSVRSGQDVRVDMRTQPPSRASSMRGRRY